MHSTPPARPARSRGRPRWSLARALLVVAGSLALSPTTHAQRSSTSAALQDGPYVLWKGEHTIELLTVEDGEARRRTVDGIREPRVLRDLPGPEPAIRLDPRPPTPPRSSWEMPSRMLAISDLEGQYAHARRFLESNGVLDPSGRWAWGAGHLVLVGDLVDRGDEVTALMWMVHRLEHEARRAGGQVHYVLGNHEAMVMAGDLRYVHPRYRRSSQILGVGYDALHSPQSEIGRWWRSKNSVTRIGHLLFVHAGYSPRLDALGLDMDTVNQSVREGLAPRRLSGRSLAENLVAHAHGPLWYRGYFDQHAAEWGGKASDAQVEAVLHRHEVRHVVIGHTLVDEVGALDASGSIIAIDTEWASARRAQGLLWAEEELWRVDMQGRRTALGLERP